MSKLAEQLRYRKLFDPDQEQAELKSARARTGFGDQREQVEYVYSPDITLAVNVALATGRPLLVRGPAGSGKSSLAPDVARRKGWDFFSEVISSRTQAQDLLWRFDAVQRLRDAQARLPVDKVDRYIEPGVLWRALDPYTARQFFPDDANPQGTPSECAVVLLDEIDKADPDIPNDLLVPLGSGVFRVTDAGLPVSMTRRKPPLIVVTTNEERDLPKAFLRRCVVLTLPEPHQEWLLRIAEVHFGAKGKALYRRVGDLLQHARKQAEKEGVPLPSTAEYLDAIEACRGLGITPDSPAWKSVELVTLRKWVRDTGSA